MLCGLQRPRLDHDEGVVRADADGDHGRQDVHEREEVYAEHEGVDCEGPAEGEDDGEQGGEGEEQRLGVAQHGEEDEGAGHKEVRGVRQEVLVKQGLLQAWKKRVFLLITGDKGNARNNYEMSLCCCFHSFCLA